MAERAYDKTEPHVVIDNIRVVGKLPPQVNAEAKNKFICGKPWYSGGLCWRPYNITYQKNSISFSRWIYLYAVTQLSRYYEGKYEHKLQGSPHCSQNNISPYSLENACACYEQIVQSYESLSPYAEFYLYSGNINISYLECAFDLPDRVPILERLIAYVCTGRGANKRKLKILYEDYNGYIGFYTFNKSDRKFYDSLSRPVEITDDELRCNIYHGEWSVICGSRNLEICIYFKHYLVRHEVRYRRGANVRTALLGRNLNLLCNRGNVEALLRKTAARLTRLYSADTEALENIETAIQEALETFDVKQEPVVPIFETQKGTDRAIYIDEGTHAYINKVYIILEMNVEHMRLSPLVSLYPRPPPRQFQHKII